MKMLIKPLQACYALITSAVLFSSCEKSDHLTAQNIDETIASTIAVASVDPASVAVTTVSTDSVYLLQSCGRRGKRDSIAQASLPASISSYLNANYSGYSFHKAFAVKNSSDAVTGYAVVIYFNDKPVGLFFDSNGSFVRVLEQREKGDLSGAGHHRGGRFEHRDGKGRDTIALTALSSSISSYFAANYPTDTLVKAFRNNDSSILVLSHNNGAFATLFNAGDGFIKREQLQSRNGACKTIALADLPSVAANYLSQTYPNYIFEKAFSLSQSGTVKGYVVLIDANNTKYAIEFDAAGNFVAAKTVR